MRLSKLWSDLTGPKGNGILSVAVIGVIVVAAILIIGTLWTGRSASQDANSAVRNVSLFYLDELAGRREQVVAQTLEGYINDLDVAVDLLDESDLSSIESLQAYQNRMKQLYSLEKFAFVDEKGIIYTSRGTRNDIDLYDFDHQTLSAPDVSIKSSGDGDKKIIIAAPVDRLNLRGNTLVACFMEMDMDHFLNAVSLQTGSNDTTFCNIYKSDGMSFTGLVLGGLSAEDNLLKAMEQADFDEGYDYDTFNEQFAENRGGIISFTYNGIRETLSYTPIHGTDWMLTYLIRESVISNQIESISEGIIRRSLILSLIMAFVLLVITAYLVVQTKKTVKLISERQTAEVMQRELEEKITLQEELIEQEKTQRQQDNMITALASDYRSVYYIDLDSGRGICYRNDNKWNDGSMIGVGDSFSYPEAFINYAEKYVTDEYRDAFLKFADPEMIREGLKDDLLITIRYLVRRNGEESYEMLRMAGVRTPDKRGDHIVHAVGAGFTDIDSEMRDSLAKNQALSDALDAAEEASLAKTVFLSNMSHEIRTPMNAIIGLNSLALRNADLSDETRGYLDKIGESARHLLGLINDILDMSRIESGRMVLRKEEFSIRSMLEQINTMVMSQCSEKGLDYECSVTGGVADFYIGDDMKLKQVLINILSNAIKFTDVPGSVIFKVERINVYEGQSTLRFTIKDTGIGMDESFIPKIFDSFTQENGSGDNKYGSTGLGMAITKNLVDLMNGTVSVESRKGLGSQFTVVVTLKNCEHSNIDSSYIHLRDLRILVVDDEEIAAEHARLVLDEAGIKSDIALSGAEALNMLEVAHTKQEHYGLVLLDWKMPEMDGIEVARRIRERYDNETTVIILTSFNWDEIMDEALHAGVDSFLAKPLFASNVIDEFDRIARKNNLVGIGKKHSADLNGRRILLAEDMAINAEIMKEVLAIKGIETETAVNGRIALEMFSNSAESYYDAVLMDVRMPEMDGLQATAAIRALDRNDAGSTPIIAMTANAFDEDVQRSLQAGMNAHLSKPVEPERLYSCLEELIGLREGNERDKK